MPHIRGSAVAWILTVTLTALAFLVSAAIFISPDLSFARHRTSEAPAAATELRPAPPSLQSPPAATPLGDADRATVLSYIESLHPDDVLVEVRPGVQAKRSNVQGVRLSDRTVYYDILGHQSFGPLASGKVRETEVHVLWREQSGPFAIVVYSLAR
jgi:hypothetical protein